SGKAHPCPVGQTPRNRVDPMLRQIRLPQALIGSHGQHIGHLPPLQEPAQFAIVAVHLVGGNPSRSGACIQCAPDHAPRQLRLGGKLDRLSNPGLPAAFSILGPLLRNVQFPVHQRRALIAGIAEKHANLAVLDAPSRAAILTLHSRRMLTLLQKTRLIDDEYRLPAVQFFHHITAYPAARLFCIPARSGPKDAGPNKAPLRPSTRPTASRSCARSRSTSLANTQGSAHAVPNAQITPRSAHAPATTRASIPPDVSPSLMPENHTPERIQSSTLIYNCSTRAVLLGCRM